MKSTTTLFVSLLTIFFSFTLAKQAPSLSKRQDSVVALSFGFFSGPLVASYTLDFSADGETTPTNNDLSISSINVGDFDIAIPYCNFFNGNTPVNVVQLNETTLVVGPPQSITSVACAPFAVGSGPGGFCTPAFFGCEWIEAEGDFLFILPCCDGSFCSGDTCKLEVIPSMV